MSYKTIKISEENYSALIEIDKSPNKAIGNLLGNLKVTKNTDLGNLNDKIREPLGNQEGNLIQGLGNLTNELNLKEYIDKEIKRLNSTLTLLLNNKLEDVELQINQLIKRNDLK